MLVKYITGNRVYPPWQKCCLFGQISVIVDALQVRLVCRSFDNKVSTGRTNLQIKAPPTKFVG